MAQRSVSLTEPESNCRDLLKPRQNGPRLVWYIYMFLGRAQPRVRKKARDLPSGFGKILTWTAVRSSVPAKPYRPQIQVNFHEKRIGQCT
ncbi:unnamed protein product [Dovyalis caffra]|uniref:Uncharacterized protein n=1 Tax=Dovyalis caffra TaxID=77055 RepID=A0AAV1R2J5_9ROSI|nr:unnamed protein product [Dovyalis caffra]